MSGLHRLIASGLTAIALVATFPQAAAACSAGPFEPREYTQLLVLGRVSSVELGATTLTAFRLAVVSVELIHVYRGSETSPLRFVDSASVAVWRDTKGEDVLEYAGGSGSCGTIDSDPVGRYVLIALARGDDGLWHANRLYGALYFDALDHPAYRWLLQRHAVPVPFLMLDPMHEVLAAPALS